MGNKQITVISNSRETNLPAPPSGQCLQWFPASLPCVLVKTHHLTSGTLALALQHNLHVLRGRSRDKWPKAALNKSFFMFKN